MSEAKQANRYRIAVLANTMQILRSFDETEWCLSVHDLANRAGLPITTTKRIVSSLESSGYLTRTAGGLVCPSVSTLTLGSAALRGVGLVNAGTGPMERLAQETGEIVSLGVLRGANVLVVGRVRSGRRVSFDNAAGSLEAATASAMGEVLLAYVPGAEPAARCAEIRRQGFATRDDGLARGVHSIAMPVWGTDATPVAALSIDVLVTTEQSIQTVQRPVQTSLLLQLLHRTVDEISLRLTD